MSVLESPETATPVLDPHHATAPADTGETRAEITHRLLTAAHQTRGAERDRLLDEAVLINRGVAETLARRYTGRGLDRDDLTQVAYLGLIKATHRYDPSKGQEFLAFAVPTITGEIKRHFRDHGWTIRPPRRIQHVQAAVNRAAVDLAQTLGRSPTATELATHLDEDLDDIIEALASRGCYTPTSIDTPAADPDGPTIADTLGTTEPGYDHADTIATLAPECRTLPPRDQRILYLRFYQGWTQQEIADELGITQMQVSRLLTRILTHLRQRLESAAR
jgi:RNA polymerase sigma-B factor